MNSCSELLLRFGLRPLQKDMEGAAKANVAPPLMTMHHQVPCPQQLEPQQLQMSRMLSATFAAFAPPPSSETLIAALLRRLAGAPAASLQHQSYAPSWRNARSWQSISPRIAVGLRPQVRTKSILCASHLSTVAEEIMLQMWQGYCIHPMSIPLPQNLCAMDHSLASFQEGA